MAVAASWFTSVAASGLLLFVKGVLRSRSTDVKGAILLRLRPGTLAMDGLYYRDRRADGVASAVFPNRGNDVARYGDALKGGGIMP